MGRGRDPPPPPAETRFDLRGRGTAQPMLPARSAPAPGPQQRRSRHFFQNAKRTQKENIPKRSYQITPQHPNPLGFVIPDLTRNPVFTWIPTFERTTIFTGINVAVGRFLKNRKDPPLPFLKGGKFFSCLRERRIPEKLRMLFKGRKCYKGDPFSFLKWGLPIPPALPFSKVGELF